MPNDMDEKVSALSMLEQNQQQLAAQRQSLQTQLMEIDSALEELHGSDESYRIIGNLMVKSDKGRIREDLESKKSIVSVKIASIEKQEDKMREKSKALQHEIVAELEKKGSKDKKREDD